MPPYLFDTSAIIEIIRENPKYDRYISEEIITTSLNLGELYYFLLRKEGEKDAELWNNILKESLVDITHQAVIKAMRLRHKNTGRNLSFVDCVSYELARLHGLTFLTADKGFTGLPGVELVV
ncbi:PIN domain-containing protein [Candidatus Woesearchaeota archaeon]|nr:PIN domain-containing protein [Candidatus Woesearchaeota archaeon]